MMKITELRRRHTGSETRWLINDLVWLFSGLFHESLRHLERILDYEEVCAFNIRRGL
jgi:hypothetical protein